MLLITRIFRYTIFCTIFIALVISISIGCQKPEGDHTVDGYYIPDINLPYMRALVNGSLYVPNGCSNCTTFRILGDTMIVAGFNSNLESIFFSIRDSSIQAKTYSFNSSNIHGASYKNSTSANDYFISQDFNPGFFTITKIDKSTKSIFGKFAFTGYRTLQMTDSIIISKGIFFAHYTTY